MMLSVATKALLFSSVLSGAAVVVAQDCGPAWVCPFTSSPPTLDADLSEWADVVSYSTTLVMIDGTQYEAGNAVYKCMHDENNIYFALEIPGDYRFNSTNNEECAAIATMMKIGAQATFLNMGGCPDALTGCTQGAIPTTCDAHRVDIGAHWELATTERGVSYPIDTTSGTGDDPVANKDDEYAVSPFCRFDDDDANAGNEWAGAWTHTNPTDGATGTYKFELSRTLTTQSTVTDAQMVPGETYEFGVAFWDPFQTEEGWTDIGHYITGCGTKWTALELAPEVTSGSASFAVVSTVLAAVLGYSFALVV